MNKKLFYLIFGLECMLCLFSCTSAPKHLAKAIAKDKPYVAKETRKLFPCIETGRDTVIVNTSDTVYDLIEAVPDTEYITKYRGTGQVRTDTVYKQRTITNTQYIEVKVKDSAEVWLWQNNFEVATNLYHADTIRLNKIIAKQGEKITTKNKWIKYLLIPYGLLILVFVVKLLLRRFKPF